MIKSSGVRAGIAIKPKTSLSVMRKLIEIADYILLLSVEPGFSGQEFMPETSSRLRELTAMVSSADLSQEVQIQADGGVDISNISMLRDLGASSFVVGSSFYGAPDRGKALEALRSSLRR